MLKQAGLLYKEHAGRSMSDCRVRPLSLKAAIRTRIGGQLALLKPRKQFHAYLSTWCQLTLQPGRRTVQVPSWAQRGIFF